MEAAQESTHYNEVDILYENTANEADVVIAIGIRAKPKGVTFVVYDSEADEVLTVEELQIPQAFAVPDSLKYVRVNLLDILREYAVEVAGIRITEPNAQTINIPRVQIEGVVQEAFASSALKYYYVGQISSITARLKIPRTDFKEFVDGAKEWEVEGWDAMSIEAREAFLCALGAANGGD